MTIHTYKVVLKHDQEATTPLQAAQAFFLIMGIGHDERTPVEVHQFIDTDIPPKVYEVDTENLNTERKWLSPEQVEAWRMYHGLL